MSCTLVAMVLYYVQVRLLGFEALTLLILLDMDCDSLLCDMWHAAVEASAVRSKG